MRISDWSSDVCSSDVVPRGAAGRMFAMPKPYPREFREDVIRVARSREPDVMLKTIAADFGISESCLNNWLKAAAVENGIQPGTHDGDNAVRRETKKRRTEEGSVGIERGRASE